VQVDVFSSTTVAGRTSAGLFGRTWEMIRNPQIESILTRAPDPPDRLRGLIDAANANGARTCQRRCDFFT